MYIRHSTKTTSISTQTFEETGYEENTYVCLEYVINIYVHQLVGVFIK